MREPIGGFGRGSGVTGSVLRWVLLWCIVAVLCVVLWDRGGYWSTLAPTRDGASRAAGAARPAADPVFNTLVYPANERGHVLVDAVINGASVRLLVDTGASLVTLTPEDARAAGITPADLIFNHRVRTANGVARMAPVTLREIRIGQLAVDDVPAAVMENLSVSLLGMSFLNRLQSYEMRNGKLTISW